MAIDLASWKSQQEKQTISERKNFNVY
jgi:hypothetical protein